MADQRRDRRRQQPRHRLCHVNRELRSRQVHWIHLPEQRRPVLAGQSVRQTDTSPELGGSCNRRSSLVAFNASNAVTPEQFPFPALGDSVPFAPVSEEDHGVSSPRGQRIQLVPDTLPAAHRTGFIDVPLLVEINPTHLRSSRRRTNKTYRCSFMLSVFDILFAGA